MPCNYTGEPGPSPFGGSGILDFDCSTDKVLWIEAYPMASEGDVVGKWHDSAYYDLTDHDKG